MHRLYIIIPLLVQTPTLENPQSKTGDYAGACWPLSWDAASVYIIKKCAQRDPCWAKTELLWPAVGSLEGENSMSGSVAAGRYGPRGLPERAAGSCAWMVLLLFKYSPLNFRRPASAGWHTHTHQTFSSFAKLGAESWPDGICHWLSSAEGRGSVTIHPLYI